MNCNWFVSVCVCALTGNFVLKEPEKGALMTFLPPPTPPGRSLARLCDTAGAQGRLYGKVVFTQWTLSSYEVHFV